MKRSELIFTFLLVPIDALMLIISFVVAYYLRKYQGEIVEFWPFADYIRFVLTVLPFWIIIFALEGLYDIKRPRSGFSEFARVFLAVSSGIMLIVAWIFLSRTMFFSRLIVIYAWVISIFFVAIGRQLVRYLQIYLYKYNIGVHRLILIGNNHISYNILREIQNNRGLGYKLIGIVSTQDDKNFKSHEHFKILGPITELEAIIKKNPVDDLILTNPNISDNRVLRIIQFCQDNQIVFKQTPNIFKVRTSNVNLTTLDGIPIVEFRRTPLEGWGKIIKRIFDVIFSLFILILFSPVFLIVAILIKLNSTGPVFFRQERIGSDGNFLIFKFRTMREGAEKKHAEYIKKYGNMFKLKNDPRATSIGKVLRKLSLDELPQFINVLLGDMSVVGPRPPMPIEVKYYTVEQKRRLGIKPGITGLWQVSGRSDTTFDEWVKLDVYYIENWSLTLDFRIILRTIWIVIAGRGAY